MNTSQNLAVPAPRTGCPIDPPAVYREATKDASIIRVDLPFGDECWMVTGYEEVRAVLTDTRFSADATRPGFPITNEEVKALVAVNRSTEREAEDYLEEQEHSRRRRMLTAEFKASEIDALRPEMQRIVDQALDGMIADGGPLDLVSRFGAPVASGVICLMLGVPVEDQEFFQQRSHVLLDAAAGPEAMMMAQKDLMEYLVKLTLAKQQNPDGGVISHLVERGELKVEEIAGTGLLLLLAGNETTAGMISLSVIALRQHPEQITLLQQDPSLIKGAVDELLRYATLASNGLPRVALQDVEIGGQLIRAGEGVLCMLSTANRDEAVFPGGDDLDLTRGEARRHVTFGHGPHQCIGQLLARTELQIALGTLLSRLPGLRLAVPLEEVTFRDRAGAYAPAALPVTW
ncbi:cytochrome P450 [Streptomyces avidinii]|uniref:Cytochrome P450 n=1 Tax=Streptomyces avidinii TaxID=1895 RepID=A0ABS4L5G3_STRAV|nr:cytochrome P450 [Streptomyces avidinii]MBP2037345.1 cytochrome P450 [Streptomyces avidinii]GGZ34860.1 cytochrome P450 [Streptomyces avidinii]